VLALVLALALVHCCIESAADVVALMSATWRERFGIGNCFRAMLEVLCCHKMFFFFDELCAPRTLAHAVEVCVPYVPKIMCQEESFWRWDLLS
jgi:hypothetical protein